MTKQTIHPELERRLATLEKPEAQGGSFGMVDWVWLLALGIVGPALLLVWGWQ